MYSCSSPGLEETGFELSSRAWIARYDIVSDDARLTKDTYPKFNATLGTKNIGPGIPADVEGPQI